MKDLSPFVPSSKSQYESTCYAYAVGYTAFSTKFNILNNVQDRSTIERTAFSSGFVASMVRSRQRAFLRLSNVKCGLYGTADKALDILTDYGCPQSDEFDCDCQIGASEKVLEKALKHRIKDYTTVTENFESSEKSIGRIQNCLNNNDPVIAAIHQTDEFYDIKKGEATLTDLNADTEGANHVVCIVGYDEHMFGGQGALLVKNNYTTWGKNGFCWVRANDFLHLVDTSYIMIV